MPVYFALSREVNRVKIGFASTDVERRFHNIQTDSAARVELAAVDHKGDTLTETELHWRFRSQRNHGEWFNLNEALAVVIAVTAETGAIPGAWYAPVGSMVGAGKARALSPKKLKAIGITPADLADITSHQERYFRNICSWLHVKHIPPLIDRLAANGVVRHPHDFFAPTP